ncbi:MAG: hypothetical protein JWM43_49 [Acidobacteriaceae bacterium]|nr:hypothetical protein [Acidobacteriaceae bacterium]
MIEIRQAQDELPGNRLLDPSGHTSGLLCRKHAQHSMRLRPPGPSGLDERTGDLARIQKHSR